MSNVPKLRFKEFSGEWEEAKLGGLIDIKSGISPSSYSLSSTGSYPFLKVEDLNNCTKYQEFSRQYSNDVKNIIPKESVIFPKRGAAILLNKVRINLQDVLMDSNLMAITPKSSTNVEYLYYKIINDKLFKIADTSTIPQINNKHILPYKIKLPSKQEQEKIASFLTSVDTKIQLLTKKEELLSSYKKGVMQKIFSGEIRFKADDGSEFAPWEKKKLGDVGAFKSGSGFPEKEQGGRLGTPFFKVSDMNLPLNSVTMTEANHYVTDEQIQRMKLKPINDASIIFAKVGAAIFLERKRLAKDFILDNNMMAFTPKENIDFIYQWINRVRLSKFAQVGALPSYNASDLKTIKISIPCLEEQTKIANFLSSIDSKIEQVSAQLNSTKDFKKALLQQMFV